MAIEDGYAICFNEWALDKNIKNELGLLLIISGLTAQEGYCFARNEYLANLFDISEDSISRKIQKLKDLGYIDIEYEKRGAEIINRKIRLTRLLPGERNQEPENAEELAIPRTTNLPVDEPQICRSTNHKNVVGYNIYNNTIDNTTIHNKENSSNQIIDKNNQNQPPKPPRVHARVVQAGSQLPKRTKGKLINFNAETKQVVIDYCLFLIDSYNFGDTQLCNRIDEIVRKARSIPEVIQVICQYNMNGGYGKLYIPGNLSSRVSQQVVNSESASEDDFVRDEDGNIEEDW